MRFIVKTNRIEKIIEASSLNEAEKKANEKYPNWQEIRYQDISNAKEPQ